MKVERETAEGGVWTEYAVGLERGWGRRPENIIKKPSALCAELTDENRKRTGGEKGSCLWIWVPYYSF